MNTNINKVTSIFAHGSAKKLYFEFFNNEGKKKQKSTGLEDTKANRAKALKLVPAFERRLEEEARKKKDELSKKKDHPLSYYALKHKKSLVVAKHSKAQAHSGRIDRILDYFGSDILPKEITELQIEEFFEQLDVIRDTKTDWLVVLRAILEKARKDGKITVNIAKTFTLPLSGADETPETKRMPFSIEEKHKLLCNANRRLRNFLGIGFYLGCRPEETLGLMIGDIKFDEKTVYLDRAVVGGEIKAITKHKGGPRDVPLFNEAIEYLQDQIAFARERKSLFLFCDEAGNRLNDSKDIRGEKGKDFFWNDYLVQLDISPIRRMMNTRHTFAIQCIESKKFNLNEIASMMGHKSQRMLQNHYAKYLGNKNDKIDRSIDIFSPSTEHSTDSEVFLKSNGQ